MEGQREREREREKGESCLINLRRTGFISLVGILLGKYTHTHSQGRLVDGQGRC